MKTFRVSRVGIGRPLPQWTVIDHVSNHLVKNHKRRYKGIKNTVKAVLGTFRGGHR